MEASMFPIASVGIGCLLSYFQPYSALPTFSLSKYILTFSKTGKSAIQGLEHTGSQEHPCLGVEDIAP